jgi:hypothetical protein
MMTDQEVWSLVLASEPLLRREICRYLPRHRRSELEEVYSECVFARAHSIMATYDPARGVLPVTHLVASVRWYAYKMWGPKKYWHYKKIPDVMDPEVMKLRERGVASRAEQEVEASTMLEAMCDAGYADEADLIRWVLMSELTYGEIGAHLGLTRAQVKTRYNEALTIARRLFDTDEDEDEDEATHEGEDRGGRAAVHGHGGADSHRATLHARCCPGHGPSEVRAAPGRANQDHTRHEQVLHQDLQARGS